MKEKPENGENGDADSTAKVKEKLENGESGVADSTATVIVDDKPPCDESDDKRVQGEPSPRRLFLLTQLGWSGPFKILFRGR